MQSSNFFNAHFVVSRVVNSRLYFQGYYSGFRSSRKNDTGPAGIGFQSTSTSTYEGLIQTANGHVEWSAGGNNKVTGGYEFEHEKFGNNGLTPDGSGNFFTRAYQSSSTFYVRNLLSLADGRLNLAGGLRAQAFSLRQPRFSDPGSPFSGLRLSDPPAAFTFDGSAAYSLRATGTKLRAHVGSGYRVPSLYERFGTFFNQFAFPPPARFEVLGDPDLKAERSIAADAGIEQSFTGDKLKLSAAFFYTRLADTIGFGNAVRDIGGVRRDFGGYENQKGGLARGGEFSASARPTGSTDIFASYTFTNSDQRSPQV